MGLTFDSGGLCLKPCDGMPEFRGNCVGAAVVVGVMKAIAQYKLPINVIGEYTYYCVFYCRNRNNRAQNISGFFFLISDFYARQVRITKIHLWDFRKEKSIFYFMYLKKILKTKII